MQKLSLEVFQAVVFRYFIVVVLPEVAEPAGTAWLHLRGLQRLELVGLLRFEWIARWAIFRVLAVQVASVDWALHLLGEVESAGFAVEALGPFSEHVHVVSAL